MRKGINGKPHEWKECKIIGVMIEREEGDLRVLRITGLLKKSEFDAALVVEVNQWRPTTHVKVLVMMEDFKAGSAELTGVT